MSPYREAGFAVRRFREFSMRKALTSLLLAAVALTPVMAQAQDSGNNRWQRSRDRSESSSETRSEQRQQRSEQRAQRREESSQATRNYDRGQSRAEAQAPVQVQQQQVIRQQAERSGGGRRWGGRANGGQQQAQQQAWQGRQGGGGNGGEYQRRIEESRDASRRSAEGLSPRYQQQAARNQQRYESNQGDRYQRGDRDRSQRDGRNGQWSSRDGRYDGNRGGYDRNGRSGNWNRNWRNDNRYDWQRYRYSNRGLFSSRYYAPYRNYRYNRLSIGLILGSAFYSDQYWLADPWQYRLPPAYDGTQWVRYYNDVLLVDVYTGEVIDVIYDFFY
jgi:hypothetical protein